MKLPIQIFNIKTLLIAFLALIASQTFGQLVINEGSNKNYSTISDEDGDFEDWIEIYNSGSTNMRQKELLLLNFLYLS